MNHIDRERMLSTLNDEEMNHLRACPFCKDDYDVVHLLIEGKNAMQLIAPPPKVWEKIEATRDKKQKTRFGVYSGLAASVLVGFVSIMTWKTHLLHQDVNALISKNTALELQIANNEVLNYQQAKIYEELQLIEEKLYLNQPPKTQRVYLKKRQETMLKIIKQQGAKYENYL